MVEASCHCKAVTLEIASPPTQVTRCNCSICRRYGTLWAYYPCSEVHVRAHHGETVAYRWNGESIEFHRCATCGCVTHWSPRDPKGLRMGINARLLDPAVLEQASEHFFDGAAAAVDPGPTPSGALLDANGGSIAERP